MPPAILTHRTKRIRTALRWLLAAIYLIAGVAHLAIPHPFLRITPAWVPFPETVIALTGACEIAGAVALLTKRLRGPAGVLLAAYAVCVYPANVKHAIDQVLVAHELRSLWYHAPRLLFQPVIVWWALFAGRVTDWPFGRKTPIAHPPQQVANDVTASAADTLIHAATLHLDRVTTLSNRNWNADTLYWGVILISGSTLIGYSAKSDGLLSSVIANQSWIIIGGYYVSMTIYFFFMYGNKHRSLVTERNRYQLAQDAALHLIGMEEFQMIRRNTAAPHTEDSAPWYVPADQIAVGYRSIRKRRIFTSSVWGAKLLSTLMMVSSIFVISQIAADYAEAKRRFDADKEMMLARMLPDDDSKTLDTAALLKAQKLIEAATFLPERESASCALIECGGDRVYRQAVRGHPLVLEAGTIVWLVGGALFLFFGLFAFFRGSV